MSVHDKLVHAMQGWLRGSLTQLFWYVLFASAVWLFFYLLFQAKLRHRRISRNGPKSRQIPREIVHSLRSIAIFGSFTAFIVFAGYSGWTRIYVRFEQHGWGWYLASLALMILIHDTYFYWTHRLMHRPRLYRFFHHTHHLSTSPTPWAAYAFSPAEAMVQAGIGPLIVFTIPVHPSAFALFMLWQISFNVLGHCGYEIWPNWFVRSRPGKLLNTVTHHGLHHEKFKANFGLYFNLWDRLMGTNHPEYEARFDQATQKPSSQRQPVEPAPHGLLAGQ